jgi:pimeloyl-ACP methyl ester carboxylesterase
LELNLRFRNTLLSLTFFALLGPSALVWAQAESSSQQAYKSGKDLCAQEPGAWIKVPSTYNLSLNHSTRKYELIGDQSNETEIFYRVYSDGEDLGPFLRPGKPTILYFEGGPAGVSATRAQFFKDQSLALGANIIAFEVRGVSCSRPASEEIYRDPSFYSALYITADAKKLIDHLGLQDVLVYGLSYGTLPARLFGYFYPENTKALLLEGTLTLQQQQRNEGSAFLEALKSLYSEQFFHSPALVLQLFSYLSQHTNFQIWMDAYLANISKVSSYFGAKGLRKYFSDLLAQSENWEELTKLVGQYSVHSPWRSSRGPGQEANIDFVVYEMLLCSDFNRTESLSIQPVTINSLGETVAKDNGGFDQEWTKYLETTCLDQKRSPEQSFESIFNYHGGHLPIDVPVLMLNGRMDFITPSMAAQKEAAQIRAPRLTFLEFEQEGHAPWNLIHLYGTSQQKTFIGNILKNWVTTGEVDFSLEDFEFMQKAHIRSIAIP